jgi:hypothetical protein
MPYQLPTEEHVAAFDRDGFVVIHGVVPRDDLRRVEELAVDLVRDRERVAVDWDWRAGEPLAERAFRIVQTCISTHRPEVAGSPWRAWATAAASRLLGTPCDFWYDMLLAKPPRASAPTPWHQDEGYWGRNLTNRGITAWFAPHDVDERNGCMHFVRGVHHRPVRVHHNPPEVASDLLVCGLEPGDEVVACPMPAGSVCFHHSGTPHMSPANESDAWRLGITHHFTACGHAAGGYYPWLVQVDQGTGRRVRAVDGLVLADGAAACPSPKP